MLTLRYSERSRADLASIWDFIAVSSPRNAVTVLDRIHDKIELLRLQPLIGHRRDDLRRGLRCMNSDGHMIFYRVAGRVVRIDRILHHSRDLSGIDFSSAP